MANEKNIYFGFNKPNVSTQGGGSFRAEKTFTGVMQPTAPPNVPLTQGQREALVEAIRVWLRKQQ